MEKDDILNALLNSCPIPITDHKEIVLGHGSGGRLTHQLIERMLLPQFKNELLEPLHDGAIFSLNGVRLAFSTDSYVVNPIFFPRRLSNIHPVRITENPITSTVRMAIDSLTMIRVLLSESSISSIVSSPYN